MSDPVLQVVGREPAFGDDVLRICCGFAVDGTVVWFCLTNGAPVDEPDRYYLYTLVPGKRLYGGRVTAAGRSEVGSHVTFDYVGRGGKLLVDPEPEGPMFLVENGVIATLEAVDPSLVIVALSSIRDAVTERTRPVSASSLAAMLDAVERFIDTGWSADHYGETNGLLSVVENDDGTAADKCDVTAWCVGMFRRYLALGRVEYARRYLSDDPTSLHAGDPLRSIIAYLRAQIPRAG